MPSSVSWPAKAPRESTMSEAADDRDVDGGADPGALVPDCETKDGELEELLHFLKRNRGFDFTGYKRASLGRRIDKRMQVVGADSYLGYLDHLEVDPEEFTQLFNTILLNVTGFFRDPPAWEYLSAEVLPRLAAEKPDGE